MVTELSPFAQGAFAYFELGWFPIPTSYFGQRIKGELVDSKKPLVKGFTGYQDEEENWTTEADISKWSRQIDKANLGLRLPKNVIGMDVDAYDDKAGKQTLEKFERDYGPLADTWVTTSKKDGVSGIRLFRLPEGVDASELVGGLPGIEIVKWNHRFISVSPSLHVKTGDPYFWIDKGIYVGADNAPGVDELAYLTILQTNGLRSDSYSAGLKRINRVYDWTEWLKEFSDLESQPCEQLESVLIHWSRKLDEASGAGGAHDVMIAGTFALLNDFSYGHRSGIVSILEQFRSSFLDAVHYNRTTGQRSLGEAEEEFDRAVRDYCEKLDTDDFVLEEPCESEAEFINEEAEEREVRKLAKKIVRQHKANQVAKAEIEGLGWKPPEVGLMVMNAALENIIEEEMCIPSMLGARHNLVISALRGTGKTMLGLNLVKSVVDEEDFLGYGVNFSGRIAWINGEMDDITFAQYVNPLRIRNADRIFLMNFRGLKLPLMNDASAEWLIKQLKANDVQWLVGDSWRLFMIWNGFDENSTRDTQSLTNRIDEIKVEAGLDLTTWLAHMGKDGAKAEKGSEFSRGNSALEDWADTVWYMRNAQAGKSRHLRVSKRVSQPFEGHIVSDDRNRIRVGMADEDKPITGRIKVKSQAEKNRERWESISDLVEMNPGIGRLDLVQMCKDVGLQGFKSPAQFSKIFDEGEKLGYFVIKKPNAFNITFHPSDKWREESTDGDASSD